MRKSTANKSLSFISKIDKKSLSLVASVMDDKITKTDALTQIDTLSSEIQKVYAGIKTLASTRSLFVKASKDQQFEKVVSGLATLATRLDLLKASVESMEDENDELEELDEDITSDDILEDLGVETESEELNDESETLENEDEPVELDDGTLENDDDVDVTSTIASKKQIVKTISKAKNTKAGSSFGLFDFIGKGR